MESSELNSKPDEPKRRSWAEVVQAPAKPRPQAKQPISAAVAAPAAHAQPRQALEFQHFPLAYDYVCQRCGEGDHSAERCLIHKTKSCQYWRAGNCRFDAASCNYAHDEELRKPWLPYCVGVFCGRSGEAIFAGCGGEHWFADCPSRVCVYCGDHSHKEAACPFL